MPYKISRKASMIEADTKERAEIRESRNQGWGVGDRSGNRATAGQAKSPCTEYLLTWLGEVALCAKKRPPEEERRALVMMETIERKSHM